MENLKLGDFVECRITGYRGILISKTIWLNGLERGHVQPRVDKDGKFQNPDEFDLKNLQRVEKR